jgi:thiosulfate/3-mercaptopyruvate sulfurtransferase
MYKTLADCRTLAAHLSDPAWVVVDCRFSLSDPDAGMRAYQAGHIPGARYAHLNNDLASSITAGSGRHPLPDPAVLAQKLGQWGIDADKQVVVYDDSFGAMAARLWWLLRWLGHGAVALLDGGLPKWQREGHPLNTQAPVISPARFVPQLCAGFWVDSQTVQHAVTQRDHRVIDARTEERFKGEVEPLDKVAGHIPGALNLPFEDNLHISGTFLPAQELRELYTGLLADVKPQQVIQMCGSGVTACHNILAMEHAGLPGARLYAGSWSEWITDVSRPVARDA